MFLTVLFLWLLCNGILLQTSCALSSVASPLIVVPSRVVFENVSFRYPTPLWWRRLTSSEPRRDDAVQSLHFTWQSQVIVLKGPSSSGKSTILKLILGDLTASNGSVQISSVTDNTTSITATKTNVTAHPTKPGICPVPILLDSQKPTYEMSRSIGDCVEGIYRLRGVHRDDASLSTLVSELFEMVGLEKYHPSIGSLTPAHLTTSERFRLELVFASLKSMSMGISEVGTDAEGSIPDPRFPAPILCIDEWLDRETSTVIQPIGEALIQLAKRWGSVIIVVTHKPERFAKLLQDNDDNTMIVQLRRGKIIQGGEHIVHSVRWNEEVKKKPK